MELNWTAIIVAIISLIGGYIVYIYLNKITYAISIFSMNFSVGKDGAIKKRIYSENTYQCSVSLMKIKILNRGFRNLKDVTIEIEKNSSKLFDYSIKNTKFVSENSITIKEDNKYINIKFEYFPRKEEIEFEFHFDGYAGTGYNTLKGAGEGYKLISEKDFLDSRKTIIFSYVMAIFAFLSISASVVDIIAKNKIESGLAQKKSLR